MVSQLSPFTMAVGRGFGFFSFFFFLRDSLITTGCLTYGRRRAKITNKIVRKNIRIQIKDGLMKCICGYLRIKKKKSSSIKDKALFIWLKKKKNNKNFNFNTFAYVYFYVPRTISTLIESMTFL